MAKVNVVNKKIKLKYADIIKMQFTVYCFFNNLSLSDNEINCLVVLSSYNDYVLSDFCGMITKMKIFKTSQTVRNFISKAQEMNLVIKTGDSKKKIKINPDLNIESAGNILLNYQFLYVSEKQ